MPPEKASSPGPAASTLEVTTRPRLPRGDREAAARQKTPAVRYVGFRTTDDGREYTCRVNDGLGQRSFVLFIGHKAFASREARFQDAPDLCCARLERELVADPDLLDGSRLSLTAQELLDYRNVREHRVPGRKRGGASPGGDASPDGGPSPGG
jgi:hypothetical protein